MIIQLQMRNIFNKFISKTDTRKESMNLETGLEKLLKLKHIGKKNREKQNRALKMCRTPNCTI